MPPKKAAPRRQQGAARTAAAEKARQEQQEQPRPPFLKPEHVGRGLALKPIPGTVRTIQGRFGMQLVVDCQTRTGTTYTFAMNLDRPNLRIFVQHVVDNPGKSFTVVVMTGTTGRSFIGIQQDDQGAQGRSDRAAAPQRPAPDDDIPF